jgi:DNA-binding MarR family transcriptional regulator
MEPRRWHDTEEARRWLQDRPRCSAILYLLARLPFLDIRVLQQLAGQQGPAGMYRSVTRLRNAGLISSIKPPVYAPNSPHLLYLSDLGVATVALDLGCDPRCLAQRFHLRSADLLRLAPTLRYVLDTYELLGALAASRPEQPTLLAWERPWRRRYARPGGKTGVSVTLPAYAALSWGSMTGAYLLLPDAGTISLRLQRATLEQLLTLRRTRNDRMPPLLIATTDRARMASWEHLLREVERARREAPLATRIVLWHDLAGGLTDLPVGGDDQSEADVVGSIRLPPLDPRRSSTPISRIVGDLRAASPKSATESLGRTALAVTPTDYRLLEVVGFHPYLCPNQLSDVLGYGVASVRRQLNRLLKLGLVRHLTEDEIGSEIVQESPELTMDGTKLVAAHLGVSLAVAVRELGLVGGGPNDPVGCRRKLVRTLAHTRGVDEVFVGLYRHSRERSAVGYDEEIVEWQNAATCSRRHLRPDGYGVYRHGARYDGFFLEYDRGTMNARDYFKKFGAYYRYGMTGRFQRDYNSYPTILVVTSDNTAEDRIARVARSLAVGQHGILPLLLTCQWRINDGRNPDMLLGRIWRKPETILDNRQHWLPESPSRVTSVLLHSKTQTRNPH